MPAQIEKCGEARQGLIRSKRRYDIDALRVFAFGLLILYHVGMLYVADWGFHIKSQYQFEWLQFPMVFLNQWRMPLLFLISGLSMSFIWGRYTTGEFAWRRIQRLGLPLVFGMAFIVAPQPYFEALSKGLIEPGFGAFMVDYLAWNRFPDGAWTDSSTATWTWNHLWYLPYVLAYTLVLIPIALLLDDIAASFRRSFVSLRGLWLFVVPFVPLMLAGLYVYPHFPYMNRGFLADWYAHSHYFTFFVLGYLIGKNSGLWQRIADLRYVSLVAGVVLYALFENREILPDRLAFSIVYMNRCAWLFAVLGWAHAYLDKPFHWLPYATSAVFAWYILHQTFIIVAGAQLSRLSLGPVVEPLLVLSFTIFGCATSYHLIIRRVRWLQPLFGTVVINAPDPEQAVSTNLTCRSRGNL